MPVKTTALTSLVNVKQYLGISSSDDDALLENIINRATDWVESYCDRKFKQRTYYEWHDGSGGRQLRLDNWPVNYVQSVNTGVQTSIVVSGNVSTDVRASIAIDTDSLRLNRIETDGTDTVSSFDLTSDSADVTKQLSTAISAVTGFESSLVANVPSYLLHRLQGREISSSSLNCTYASNADNEYRVDVERGIVFMRSSSHFDLSTEEFPARFPRSRQSILVVYDAGYATVPDDIEHAAIEFVQKVYAMRSHDPNVSSEGLGDYNYGLRPSAEVLNTISSALQPHIGIR